MIVTVKLTLQNTKSVSNVVERFTLYLSSFKQEDSEKILE